MFTFNGTYFGFAVFLFLIEAGIALYVHEGFVRFYLGDYLVVMLLYCAVKAVVNASPFRVALGVLLFSCLVEVLQSVNLIGLLGLQHSNLAKTVMGQCFEWTDLLAYTLGVLSILALESIGERKEKRAAQGHGPLRRQKQKTNQTYH